MIDHCLLVPPLLVQVLHLFLTVGAQLRLHKFIMLSGIVF